MGWGGEGKISYAHIQSRVPWGETNEEDPVLSFNEFITSEEETDSCTTKNTRFDNAVMENNLLRKLLDTWCGSEEDLIFLFFAYR